MINAEQEVTIRKMHGQHRTITEISKATGVSYFEIQGFLREWHFRTDYWTKEEDEILRREIEAGKKYREVAAMLPGRSEDAVRHRVTYFKIRKIRSYNKTNGTLSFSVPDKLIQDRDVRLNEYRTTTQLLMGDPPPSRSALGRPCQ